ncbi:ribonuclease Z [Echinicola strongylocentroti]|uniref:Ribonuclease Z n=1 Tax=Echinicola strongylocentroti TaxID=1795355 RepID=A0A2Z4IDM9_9BACT|nr:ribonuclease Z [Echinicola strongylocentroti]AWW28984.1 ribonuclease Z [Echinicola strongylocentroti]
MEFSVTILGSNSAVPAHNRNQTSQIVTLGSKLLMVDCGEATQIQLQRYKIRSFKIDHIFISHLHGDHYLGLMGVISTFHLNKRKTPLTIYGPRGLDEIITTQLKYGNTKLNYPLHFVRTDPDEKQLLVDTKKFMVYSFPLKHRLPCTGFLIVEKPGLRHLIKEKLQEQPLSIPAINVLKHGKDFMDKDGNVFTVEEFTSPPDPIRKYAFCSDTIFDETLVTYLKEADLLYHESTFMESECERAAETYHCTASQAATIAKKANVKQLLLGHYSTRYVELEPLLEEASSVFDRCQLSIEGETYHL